LSKQTDDIGTHLRHVAGETSDKRLFFCLDVARLAATVLLPRVGSQNVRGLLKVVDEICTRAHLVLSPNLQIADLEDEFLKFATMDAAEQELAWFMVERWVCDVAPGAQAA
jgi:hypothetical protein